MQPTTPEAYAFNSPQTLGAMLASLNAAGPWHWTMRDSDTFGAYLTTRPDGGPTQLRIIDRLHKQDGHAFLLDVFYLSGSVENRLSHDDLIDAIQRCILPAIEAQDVCPVGGL